MAHPQAPDLAVDITESMIGALVDAFYAKVRADAVLGPIFDARIAASLKLGMALHRQSLTEIAQLRR